MKIKKHLKNAGWCLANKTIVPLTMVVGTGAASKAGSLTSMIEGGYTVPYKLASHLITDNGAIGYIGKVALGLAHSVVEHPTETLGCLAGSYLVGKGAKWYSERKRLKAKYRD